MLTTRPIRLIVKYMLLGDTVVDAGTVSRLTLQSCNGEAAATVSQKYAYDKVLQLARFDFSSVAN